MQFRRRVEAAASEERLEGLIRERLKPGSDKAAIDERIWELFGEDWAVMFTDLSGFSRQVAEFGIIHFLQTIYESERILLPIIEASDGILLKIEGDSLLVIFRTARKAVEAARAMQAALRSYNADRVPEERVLLCVGLGYGRVLRIGDSDVFGAEVNAASKLGEDIAKAGEILVTQGVKAALEGSGMAFELIDEVPPGASAAYRLVG
jgi:class 3 adenylate cyclase